MANPKILEQKQLVIDEIKEKIENSNGVVLFDYRGLTDAEIKELKLALREVDSEYKVYKNTLMQRALNDLNIDISEHLNGPSALAYSVDQIAPIKVIANFMKKHKAVTLKVGLVDNEITFIEEKGGGWVDNPFFYATLCKAKSIRNANRTY